MSAWLEGAALMASVVGGGMTHQLVRSRRWLASLDRSIDRVCFAGREVFGANKTLRGVVVMPSACGALFWLERAALGSGSALVASLPWFTGLLAGAAYVLAELPNSALKRRLGIAPGTLPRRGRALFFTLDHLDSAVGCALVFRLVGVGWPTIGAGLALAPLLHVAVNRLSHAVGIRGSAW